MDTASASLGCHSMEIRERCWSSRRAEEPKHVQNMLKISKVCEGSCCEGGKNCGFRGRWLCLLRVDGEITRGQLIGQKQDWRSGTLPTGHPARNPSGAWASFCISCWEWMKEQQHSQERGKACLEECHLVLGTERTAGRDPQCYFPTATGHCSRCQQPIVALA